MDIPLEGSIRFLIVDDDVNLRKMMLLRLKMMGFDVETTDRGDEALGILRERFKDIILLDIHLPGEDGEQILHAIRKLPQGQSVPVFILTGDSNAQTVNRFIGLGLLGYLLKPLDFRKLAESIQTIERKIQNRRTQLYLQNFFDQFNDESVAEDRKLQMVKQIYHSRFFNEFLNNPAGIKGEDRTRLLRIMQQFFKGIDRMMLERIDATDERKTMESLRIVEQYLAESPDGDMALPLSRIISRADERVASKAAKLLGKVTDDLFLLRRFLLNRNSRFVANLLEALWKSERDDVLSLFQSFLASPVSRIRANCIVGIHCRGRLRIAFEALHTMLSLEESPDMLRSAIWAACRLGVSGHPYQAEPRATDEELLQLSRTIRRRMAENPPTEEPFNR